MSRAAAAAARACCFLAFLPLVSCVDVHKTIKLNNGVTMPTVIYGAGGAHTQDNVTGTAIAVAMAVSPDVGFAGIDSANHYHNQIGVRDGIRASGTPRSKLWIQTKDITTTELVYDNFDSILVTTQCIDIASSHPASLASKSCQQLVRQFFWMVGAY